MNNYTENQLIHLAKRFNNNKRSFLLINPLQAKHMPVSPNECLNMIGEIGKKVSTKYKTAKLVIGFAETATAVGYIVAKELGNECIYITTTREDLGEGSYFEFKEEHSHAVDQKIYDEKLEEYISKTDEIILVDDELTTGKTVLNFINQLKEKYPIISQKKIIAVSIINRLNKENILRLEEKGILCEYLIKPTESDYNAYVEQFDITPQEDYFENNNKNNEKIDIKAIEISKFNNYFNKGVNIKVYNEESEKIIKETIDKISDFLNKEDNVLILGTEEFMYPSILLGKLIEDNKLVRNIKCHATTRSPIGICQSEEYPIKNGFKLNSFYEVNRQTFIYNLKKYDKVIVFTDSNSNKARDIAILKLAEILGNFNVNSLIFLKGGFNV